MSGANLFDMFRPASINGGKLLLLLRLRRLFAKLPERFIAVPLAVGFQIVRESGEFGLSGFRVDVVDLRFGSGFGFRLRLSFGCRLRGLLTFTAGCAGFQAGDFGAGIFQFAFAFFPADFSSWFCPLRLCGCRGRGFAGVSSCSDAGGASPSFAAGFLPWTLPSRPVSLT